MPLLLYAAAGLPHYAMILAITSATLMLPLLPGALLRAMIATPPCHAAATLTIIFRLIVAAISPHSQRHLFRAAIAGAATLDARAMRDAQQPRCADALTPLPPCHAGARYAGDGADAACYAISPLMMPCRAPRQLRYAAFTLPPFQPLLTLILLITLSGAVTPAVDAVADATSDASKGDGAATLMPTADFSPSHSLMPFSLTCRHALRCLRYCYCHYFSPLLMLSPPYSAMLSMPMPMFFIRAMC
jgi:hypothetical protein